MKNCQNFLAKGLKEQFTGTNMKQNVRLEIRQTSIDIFLNQYLQGLTDCLCRLSNQDNDAKKV